MKVNITFCWAVTLISLISISIWSCAGKPFDPPQAGEIPKGEGIFSKDEEGVVLYDSNTTNKQTISPSLTPATSAGGTKQPAVTGDYEEFEAYRQWLHWKKTAVGTPEYEEFQQWREWLEYQEWKNRGIHK